MSETTTDEFPALPADTEITTEYAVQWAPNVDPTVPAAELMEPCTDRRKAESLVDLYGSDVRMVERTVTRGPWTLSEAPGGQR